MKFKEFYTEGRNRWSVFELKMCEKRWSILNTESGQRFYIKVGEKPNDIGGMQKFLEQLLATPASLPKTKGEIDFHEFATKVVAKEKANIYVKSGMWDQIKKTWVLEETK